LPRGLVLIGGPTGSGKTTTLAALVEEINRRDARHIVTIEDPIEYEHAHYACVVEQVEIGVDAPDFPTALRASLRQAPDVIVVGEMRDPETMRRQGTSCCRRCTPPTPRRLSPASPTRFPTSGRIRSGRSWQCRWPR
jgi:twitching motility protein PilT